MKKRGGVDKKTETVFINMAIAASVMAFTCGGLMIVLMEIDAQSCLAGVIAGGGFFTAMMLSFVHDVFGLGKQED